METFIAKFYDAKGGSHIAHAFFVVQARETGKACSVRYDPRPNQFYLLDDNGNRYLGAVYGVAVLGLSAMRFSKKLD